MRKNFSIHLPGPERSVLERLDDILKEEAVRARIDAVVAHVEQTMVREPTRPMGWEPVPLSVYGEALPPMIRSSWVFILRAGAITGAERHPNSHQRMMSYRGSGDLQIGGEGQWESHPLVSDASAGLERRWVSVPPNIWHQAVVPDGDWVVVSFHTVAAHELIEERPDPRDSTATLRKHYGVKDQPDGTVSSEDIRLRDFRSADLASVRRLIHNTIGVSYSRVYPPRAVQFFRQFHSEQEILARSEAGEILVAEREGTIVATGALVGREILGVFVDAQCQDRGYGTAVMRELERRAKERGCKEVELSVSLPSRGFYERRGYQVLEECSIDVGEGERLRFWKARKSLG
jgi:ribosomal protein S18 acetylase RimI-like enzyme